MDERKPSDEAARIVVRLPDGLRDRLNARAKMNGRSANAEAVMALEAWLGNLDLPTRTGDSFEERFRTLIGSAVEETMKNPDFIRRMRELDDIRRARVAAVTLQSEDGQTFNETSRLAEADALQGNGDWLPVMRGEPVPPEEAARRAQERFEQAYAALKRQHGISDEDA